MKNLLFLFLLAVASCKTPMGTPTTIYGVVEQKVDKGRYEINDGQQKTYLDGAKAGRYLGRYVKAEGLLSHVRAHGVAGDDYSLSYYQMWDAKFTLVKDCDAIAKIISTPEFDTCFAICRKPDAAFILYCADYGDLNLSELCGPLTTACSKPVTFAKADFDVNKFEASGKVINPRIVVWKENNQYHFFETETNRKLTASVKRGKVKVLSTGVF